MSKGIVLYKSKYGATKQYATWLAEMTGFDLVEISKANIHDIETYNTIILCGGVYASSIAGLSFLKKHAKTLHGKKIVILAVGATPYEEHVLDTIREHNLKHEIKDLPLFYAHGVFDENKMSFRDRTLIKMLRKSLKKKDPNTYTTLEQTIMSVNQQKANNIQKEYLAPLIAYLSK